MITRQAAFDTKNFSKSKVFACARIAFMKQKRALDILKTGRNVYLTGPAGSGKTHLIREYISHLRDRGIYVGLTASTGIAATHFGGVTIHSWSGIGIRETLSEREIDELVGKEYLWKRFDKARVLIIDEVSMLSPQMFDSIERLARSMKNADEPFGGLQIILSGDFFQLPPIVRGNDTIAFIDSSSAWKNMNIRVCYLNEQFRQQDQALENILKEIRGGAISEKSREVLLNQHNNKLPKGITPTRLYTHNKDVDALNDEELNKISEKLHTYTMRTKGKQNLVTALTKGLLSPETLGLKKGAVVMFTKNNFEMSYVNGTLGKVKDFHEGMPVVETFSGDTIYVDWASWAIEDGGKILAEVEQLPLRLAWAITVHKSQGMNMDAAEIDLSSAFVPGQGYVALSRLRSLQGLVLNGANEMAFTMNPSVLELDHKLLSESEVWNQKIQKFTRKEIEAMQDEFIKRSGGTTDKKEIAKNQARGTQENLEKIPTHIKTKKLLEEDLTLKEIAKKRGMTVGTIIGHFEKLQELDNTLDLEHFRPKTDDLKKIKKAFGETKDTRLVPVHRKLKGAYSYEELRLARLFIK